MDATTTRLAIEHAFGTYLFLDVWRVVTAAFGLLVGCALLKVAWLRWWQKDPTLRDVLAWVSHSCFALGAALFMLLRLGNPPMSVLLLTLGSIGVVTGVLALDGELGFPPWAQRLLHRKVGRRTRCGRKDPL